MRTKCQIDHIAKGLLCCGEVVPNVPPPTCAWGAVEEGKLAQGEAAGATVVVVRGTGFS